MAERYYRLRSRDGLQSDLKPMEDRYMTTRFTPLRPDLVSFMQVDMSNDLTPTGLYMEKREYRLRKVTRCEIYEYEEVR